VNSASLFRTYKLCAAETYRTRVLYADCPLRDNSYSDCMIEWTLPPTIPWFTTGRDTRNTRHLHHSIDLDTRSSDCWHLSHESGRWSINYQSIHVPSSLIYERFVWNDFGILRSQSVANPWGFGMRAFYLKSLLFVQQSVLSKWTYRGAGLQPLSADRHISIKHPVIANNSYSIKIHWVINLICYAINIHYIMGNSYIFGPRPQVRRENEW